VLGTVRQRGALERQSRYQNAPWNLETVVLGDLIKELRTHTNYAVESLQNTILKEIQNSNVDLVVSGGGKEYEIDFKNNFLQIESLLKNYGEIQADRIVRDLVWLIVGASSRREVSQSALRALHRSFSTIFEPDTLVERPEQISASKTLEGLAKIVRLTSEYAPDIIVTAGAGWKDHIGLCLRLFKAR
jgi:hypothetical protein